jgi:hypothetical protein
LFSIYKYFFACADVSTTMIVKPGPVVDFLLANQKVDHPNRIDWGKVKLFFNLLMKLVDHVLYLFISVPCLTL